MDTFTKIMIGFAILTFLVMIAWSYISITAPCDTFSAVSVKELPVRCLNYFNVRGGEK